MKDLLNLSLIKSMERFFGAFIVGPHATDIIGELLSVKASEGTIHELSQIIQPHPALLEAIGESADAFLILQFICSFKLYDL